jgi:hypothetical protein
MTKITPEDLVRYLYNETSERKTALIKAELQTDWNLRVAFEKLLSAQQHLQEITFSPRQETINTTLKYASKKQTQIHSL